MKELHKSPKIVCSRAYNTLGTAAEGNAAAVFLYCAVSMGRGKTAVINENTPRLETERLILRKFDENDLDDMLLLYGDETVNTYLPWFPMKTRMEVLNYLHNTIFPCYQKPMAYTYAVALKRDNRVIGYVHVNDLGGSNDIGYALRKEFWHKGITCEACAAVVERLKQAAVPFITATHDINNPNSGKVMRKLGMSYRYSYIERWQPKNILVTFRMYQLNLDGAERLYTGYQQKYPFFVEQIS